jgi:hypothetical protein
LPILVTVLGILIDVILELMKAYSPILVTPLATMTLLLHSSASTSSPEITVYDPFGPLEIPVRQLKYPSGTADADGLATVSTEAINKKGNRTLKNFDLVNTGHSPTLDKQESGLAQLITPTGHPRR